MKLHIIMLYLMAAISSVVISSCSDMDDNYKEFVEGGEIIYAAKPDTIFFNTGKNRVELNCRLSKAPFINAIVVSWDNGAESKTFPINPGEGTYSEKFIIDGLDERSYDFLVKTVDKDGNESLPLNASCRSYGTLYESALAPLTIEALSATENGEGMIRWGALTDNVRFNEIKYVDKDGTEQTIQTVPAEVSLLPNVKTGSSVSYRTAYAPDKTCIDVFFSEWVSSEENGKVFPHSYTFSEDGIDRMQWDVLLCESEQQGDGDGIRATLDGNRNSYWHSGYGDNRKDTPFCFIFDMKDPLWIGQIGVMQRNGGYNFRMTEMEIFISTDEKIIGKEENNWISLGKIAVKASDDMQWFDVPMSTIEQELKGRYIKAVVTDTWDHDGITGLAEFAVKRIVAVDGQPI